MKVEVIKTAKKPIKPFPKLMVTSNNVVVLFIKTKIGTVIEPFTERGHVIGMHFYDWCMDDFKDFEGCVILSND